MENRFVSVKQAIQTDTVSVQANEVGIVQESKGELYTVLLIVSRVTIVLAAHAIEFFDPAQTGDAFETKICNICHRRLATTEFARNQNGINNRIIRRPSCNECRILLDGVKVSAKERKKWEANRPNLQPFECPICKKITIPGLTSKIVLDHDHSTGKIRGWICDSCNTGIGRFKDDVNLLLSAINYLETTKD